MMFFACSPAKTARAASDITLIFYQSLPDYFGNTLFLRTTMKYNIRDIFEYIIALVNEFAKRFNMSDLQAYQYIRTYQGISFIENNYGIIHTLDINEALNSIVLYCRKTGGAL